MEAFAEEESCRFVPQLRKTSWPKEFLRPTIYQPKWQQVAGSDEIVMDMKYKCVVSALRSTKVLILFIWESLTFSASIFLCGRHFGHSRHCAVHQTSGWSQCILVHQYMINGMLTAVSAAVGV